MPQSTAKQNGLTYHDACNAEKMAIEKMRCKVLLGYALGYEQNRQKTPQTPQQSSDSKRESSAKQARGPQSFFGRTTKENFLTRKGRDQFNDAQDQLYAASVNGGGQVIFKTKGT